MATPVYKTAPLSDDDILYEREADKFDTDSFLCGMSKKRFFVVLNALAALFHLALLITTIAVTCNSDAKCGGPVVHTYETYLEFRPKSETSGFELYPKYEKNTESPIHLVALPVTFFGLSCLAHITIAILAACTNIYRDWLLTCQQPLRWVEYAFSASTMFIAIAYTSGIRDTNMIIALFILMFCVITYGWVCEMLADRTVLTDHKTDTTWKIIVRLFPNIIGWVPYVAAYYIVLEQYMRVTETYKGNHLPEGNRMPPWVDYVVIGQCLVFTSFAIVSILQQIWRSQWYYLGEIIYVILSFVSKGFLGLVSPSLPP